MRIGEVGQEMAYDAAESGRREEADRMMRRGPVWGFHLRFRSGRIRQSVQSANFTNLSHAAAAVRVTARRSIRKAPRSSSQDAASAPGMPPHTRHGQIKRAILYSVERKEGRAFIGATYEAMGMSASAHEFGGRFRGQRYRKRPFMGPALQQNVSRLPRMWAGSVR